jgi:hypothetical protein
MTTFAELAPVWNEIVEPAVRAAGVPVQDVENATQDFAVYVLERDLLAAHDPERMPVESYLRGYARKFALRTRQSALGFGYELILDEPEAIEPGQDDPIIESIGDLNDIAAFLDWLEASDRRRPHAELLHALVDEVFTRDKVNRHRITATLGWSAWRVNCEIPQLREAGLHWGLNT